MNNNTVQRGINNAAIQGAQATSPHVWHWPLVGQGSRHFFGAPLSSSCPHAMSSRKRRAPESAGEERAQPAETWVLCRKVQACGGDVSGVEARSAGAAGAGLFATRDLEVGDCVARVPSAAVLSTAAALASPVGAAVTSHFRVADEDEDEVCVTARSVLYLYLLALRHQTCMCDDDAHAAHVAYCRSLPAVIDLPITWPASDEDLLAGTELQRSVAVMRAALRRRFDVLFPRLYKVASLFPRKLFTFDAFLWAHAAYSSRAFPASSLTDDERDDELRDGVLVPLLDIANHSSDGADMCVCFVRTALLHAN